MLLSCTIVHVTRKTDELAKIELKSQRYKKRLFLVNLLCMILAGYFFMRHNSYCEPGMYSLFALAEYIFVFTNMGFHMTAYWDFSTVSLIYDWRKGIHFSQL